VNNRGQQVKVLNVREPREGRDVYLTIDAQFQLFIWRMMRSEKGAAIFMDPRNGEILSLVSSPSYDPNISLADVLNAEDSPLLNRAIMGQYPPGSLFKLVVALAGLESGKILADQSFQCRGKLDIGSGEFNCWNLDGHGNMALRDAIIQSCNVYFYNTGILLGVEKICEYAKLLGFSKKTGIELFGETKGLVPSRVWKRIEKGEGWFTGDTANLSIGQGYLLATPLQVVRMIACVANGGMLVEPHVVKGVGETWISGHKNIRLKIKKENLDIIRDAMRGVVEDRHGTGRLAWNSYVTLSGKTGTSQVGGDLRPHAWFGGFAPSENPEISFVIFLEHGGSGGDIAALMVRKAMEYWFIHKK
ncbi:MAG: penicillin-binding protein 2, partial [Candidatus Omnitrophica bacterium]|nr:penicillin-binding protein 2 [Candidatus Omnitrophota bacterium]